MVDLSETVDHRVKTKETLKKTPKNQNKKKTIFRFRIEESDEDNKC